MKCNRLLLLVCLLMICTFLCGAAKPETMQTYEKAYEQNEECTRKILEALMAGEQQPILDVMGLETGSQFQNTYRHMAKEILGNPTYDLEILSSRTVEEDGYLIHKMTYRVIFANRRAYRLEVFSAEGFQGLHYFQMVDLLGFTFENHAPALWKNVVLGFSLAMIAFLLWMFVDCVRRTMKTKHKVLWCLVILVFVGGTFSWGGGWFQILPNVFFPWSDISLVGGLWQLQAMLPIGAIVYFFCRKRITARYLAARKAYYDAKAPLDFTLDNKQ